MTYRLTVTNAEGEVVTEDFDLELQALVAVAMMARHKGFNPMTAPMNYLRRMGYSISMTELDIRMCLDCREFRPVATDGAEPTCEQCGGFRLLTEEEYEAQQP